MKETIVKAALTSFSHPNQIYYIFVVIMTLSMRKLMDQRASKVSQCILLSELIKKMNYVFAQPAER